MKRLFITLSIVMLAMAGNAQNFSTLIHHGSYHLSQCYDIIEMSDGNLAVKEAVFNENMEDIGYNLYKTTTAGELLDSLFIEDHHITSLSPMLRDPDRDDSNIMTSFYTDDNGRSCYKAVCFSDNLEVTGEVNTELPEGCPLPSRFLIDCNGDIVCRTKTEGTKFRFLRIDPDGEVKKMSGELDVESYGQFYEHPLFTLSADPLRYGYVTYGGENVAFEVYDGDFNRLSRTVIKKFDGWKMRGGGNYNVAGCGDGHFYMTIPVYKQFDDGLMVVKLNSDIEIESTCLWGVHPFAEYPESSLVNKNLAVTENGVFVVWTLKKAVETGSGSKTSLIVTRYDRDLNPSWETETLDVINSGLFGNYGLNPLGDGGVALSGWFAVDDHNYYSTKDIYAIMFDNCSTVPEAHAAESCLVYPNPVSGNVNVKVPSGAEIESVSLFDISGRLVKAQQSGFGSIDISGLATGMYVMKVALDDGKVFEEKIVKK
ncbi:MAG: T9SS type A sorting domain-containing protein [Bacteroidales bacterium]|nr:T9SS type A sorting domain-containing protein [Bacteroidales bacterium]